MHDGGGKRTEVARVPCQFVQLEGKVTRTELYIRTQPDGSRVLA